MFITIVSSLDSFCRQQACEAAGRTLPGAVVVLHDLLEEGRVIRRIFEGEKLIEREETILEHGCLSCTVRLDVVPTVEHLLARGVENIVLGLPPAVTGETAVEALHHGITRPFSIDSVALACSPDAVEDQIWDHHTLFESGFTPVPWDNRTPGEFLIGELSFCDTVILAEPALIPVDPKERRRGVHLIEHLAPHAELTAIEEPLRTGHHNLTAALLRSAPGTVRVPAGLPSSSFCTVVQTARRPLHPERFRKALAELAAGCCWLRGRLWVAAAPESCIAVQGIGPRVWLENTGPWRPEPVQPDSDGQSAWFPYFGERGSVLAVTGEEIDADEIRALITGCELTDAEMAAGAEAFSDPFNLKTPN
ncbi:GTP-binding protein [Arthrobacter tecti]